MQKYYGICYVEINYYFITISTMHVLIDVIFNKNIIVLHKYHTLLYNLFEN